VQYDYYQVYSYFKYIKQYNSIQAHEYMAKEHITPKDMCINYESGCAKIVNNVSQLLAREKQWWHEELPTPNSYQITQRTGSYFLTVR